MGNLSFRPAKTARNPEVVNECRSVCAGSLAPLGMTSQNGSKSEAMANLSFRAAKTARNPEVVNEPRSVCAGSLAPLGMTSQNVRMTSQNGGFHVSV